MGRASLGAQIRGSASGPLGLLCTTPSLPSYTLLRFLTFLESRCVLPSTASSQIITGHVFPHFNTSETRAHLPGSVKSWLAQGRRHAVPPGLLQTWSRKDRFLPPALSCSETASLRDASVAPGAHVAPCLLIAGHTVGRAISGVRLVLATDTGLQLGFSTVRKCTCPLLPHAHLRHYYAFLPCF